MCDFPEFSSMKNELKLILSVEGKCICSGRAAFDQIFSVALRGQESKIFDFQNYATTSPNEIL